MFSKINFKSSSAAPTVNVSPEISPGPMADPKVIIEGEVKHRTSKKWKSRWCVLTKLSPVADCMHLQVYRDSKERRRNGPTKSSLSLDGFLALESSFTLDKESNTLALICHEIVVILAFDSREKLIQWTVHVRQHTQDVEQFLVQLTQVPTKSKLNCGPVRLHLQNRSFCLVTGLPPRLVGHWNIPHLRKFGLVDGKFCFEGGSLSLVKGLHVIQANNVEQLIKAFQSAAIGKLEQKFKPRSAPSVIYSTHSLSEENSSTSSCCQSPFLQNYDIPRGPLASQAVYVNVLQTSDTSLLNSCLIPSSSQSLVPSITHSF